MPIGKVVAVIFFVKIPGLAGYMYFQQRALGYGLMLVRKHARQLVHNFHTHSVEKSLRFFLLSFFYFYRRRVN